MLARKGICFLHCGEDTTSRYFVQYPTSALHHRHYQNYSSAALSLHPFRGDLFTKVVADIESHMRKS